MLTNQQTSIKNLEVQVEQIIQILNQKPSGALSSDKVSNPKEKEKEKATVMNLRNGKQVEVIKEEKGQCSKVKVQDDRKQPQEDEENKKKKENEDSSTKNNKVHVPKLSFPQVENKNRLDKQITKFIEVIKQFHINIPFFEALKQMPIYAKFMKELLFNKRNVELGYVLMKIIAL